MATWILLLTRAPMINSLEKLAAWLVFSLAILVVYGFLSVAWAGSATYTLWYWDEGWNIGTSGLSIYQCEDARLNFRLHGGALERWSQDKNKKQHLPHCELEVMHNVH